MVVRHEIMNFADPHAEAATASDVLFPMVESPK
jgi:hypothetical protein